MDETTRRLIPPVCFSCGMPLNNRQQTFDTALMEPDVTKKEIFERLCLLRDCCRITMAFSADDTRLHRNVSPPNSTFVAIHRASRLESAVYTVKADGTADLVPTV